MKKLFRIMLYFVAFADLRVRTVKTSTYFLNSFNASQGYALATKIAN